jgi:SagB-type dehydrogenase family enzyme
MRLLVNRTDRRGKLFLISLSAVIILITGPASSLPDDRADGGDRDDRKTVRTTIALPDPVRRGPLSVEEAVQQRRSVRSFTGDSLSQEQLSTLLWSAQGITGPRKFKRAAPSAGALYPLEIFVVIGTNGVKGMGEGIYRYIPKEGSIERISGGDRRKELTETGSLQSFVGTAPVIFVFAADYSRTTVKYGKRGRRYVHIDTGAAGENLFLECQALGLAACMVGAFSDDGVKKALQLGEELSPLLVMPAGYPR